MPVTIGVPRESAPGERRVALVPDVVRRLAADETRVIVERGAGESAYLSDDAYAEAGAELADRAAAHAADVVLRVGAPSDDDLPLLRAGAALVGMLRPLDEPARVARIAGTGVTAMAMELVPRTTRAQKMDALSAMATVAGYRAVLLAAAEAPKFFPLLMTAAGTIRPAKVLVLGAGVAGLQAIATARRLGAVVSAYDVRPPVREQVESLGARWVDLQLETAGAEGAGGYARALGDDAQQRQADLLVPVVADADVVVTTALVPGRPAPLLLTDEAVEAMAPGSVVVDLAAPNGGNCAATVPGETTERGGVRILAPLDLPAGMPLHASQMYARTVAAMAESLVRDGRLDPDPEDEIFAAACVARGGEVVHPRVLDALSASTPS